MNEENLGKALGRLSSGVYITTIEKNNEKHGMLATWIIQASFKPPMLTMAVQSERDIFRFLEPGSSFSVNAISKKNMDIFKAFAKPHKDGEDRFAGLKLAELDSAGPVFAEALSYLDCVVKEHVAAGDHTIVIAEVTAGQLLNDDEPMLHTRKNGFQY